MKDYSKLEEITVKTQEELNDIPSDFQGRIYIEFGTFWERAVISKKYRYSVEARGNSSVVARGNSSVVAWGNSSVEAWENSSVEAWENSSVEARGNSSVVARGNSSVVAWENSSVVARGNSSVEAWENSSVEAWENSSVVARGNSSVEAWENSSVEAWENSSVEAWENSSVVARGNSSVVARGNSSVVANGNTQIVDRLVSGRIEITGNARIVYMPKTIDEYCAFYNIKHDKKKGVFYKCVHKREDKYISDHDRGFEYRIGEKVKSDSFDNDVKEDCGRGIHIAYKAWVLDYGRNWNDLAILELEVDLDSIIIPVNSSGKIRCPEAKVIREVPLEECGTYGRILAARIKKTETTSKED
ncbi:MAG: hypothetical protein J1F01_05580 [Oscillospiraceae bacterium]|nr:hypothetical protein [Oscillospiraceae bacterium]